MASKKIVLAADGVTTTVTDATVSDIVSTMISSDTVLTGAFKYAQDAAKVLLGMAYQSHKMGGSYNPFA
jgi:serine/threonine protein phosphatase PrpC